MKYVQKTGVKFYKMSREKYGAASKIEQLKNILRLFFCFASPFYCTYVMGCIYAKRIQPENCKTMSLEKAKKKQYCECSYCRGLLGEVRTKEKMLGKWEKKHNLKIRYLKNTDTLYIQTEAGFWKVFLDEKSGKYLLFHRNIFRRNMSFEEAVHGQFHRQRDVKSQEELERLLDYLFAMIEAQNPEMREYAVM